ncbi:MAG: C40 family peptidase [Flavobacteriales bacterium]
MNSSNLKQLLFLIPVALLFASCGASHQVSHKTKTHKTVTKNSNNKTESIIKYAKTFKGTRYKYGGTTKKGMDCSGLVFVAFKKEGVNLPRVSRDMATRGKSISISKTTKGDLIFFRTNKNKKSINHVGLVVEKKGTNILFIHSTSSKGVIISSLNEKYWKNAFVSIRRIL